MLKRFIRYLNNKNQMIKAFRESGKYLQDGEYLIDNSLTYICVNDKSIMSKAEDMFKNDLGTLLYNNKSEFLKKKVMYIIKILVAAKLKASGNKKCKEEFSGSVFAVSGNGKDYKIFDFKNKKVLWKFSCEEGFISKINNYEFFSRYFTMPKQYGNNHHERMVIEEYIDFIPYNHWTDQDYSYVINQTFDKYIYYFQQCRQLRAYNYSTINYYLEELQEQDSVLQYVKNNIQPELLKMKIPVLRMHGDLWTSNMLLGKEPDSNVYYIDWEHSKELVFFYDFFFILWNDAFLRANHYYLEQFIRGEYDNHLEEIFSIFDLQYNGSLKVDYFSMFFLVKFKERWESESYKIQEEVLNQYKKIVSMMRRNVSEE